MPEEAIKRRLRTLLKNTLRIINSEGRTCGGASGDFANIATALAWDKSGTQIIKSVINKITRSELDRLLNYNNAPLEKNIVIEVWFWKPNCQAPFQREKLFYSTLSNHSRRAWKNVSWNSYQGFSPPLMTQIPPLLPSFPPISNLRQKKSW